MLTCPLGRRHVQRRVASKKPSGLSGKPIEETGITGQSSGRGTWMCPNMYQTTTSVFSMLRSAAVQRGRPSPPGCWLG